MRQENERKTLDKYSLSIKKWVSLNSKYRSVILTFGVHFNIINAEKYPKGDAAMDSQYLQIQTLLEQKAEITARLNLIPYDGSIEIKDRHG